MTKRRAGIALVIAGAVLLMAALLLYAYNLFEDAQAGRQSDEILDEMQTVIVEKAPPAATQPPQTQEEADDETVDNRPMPTIKINGRDYIGYLEIPDLKLKLPVMADWDYNRLKVAPCRHFGTTYANNLVIAAHNFKKHFGLIDTLKLGAPVTFTDADGVVSTYRVGEIINRNPDEVEAVRDSQWDLVLYTCTYGGEVRIVVGCERAE